MAAVNASMAIEDTARISAPDCDVDPLEPEPLELEPLDPLDPLPLDPLPLDPLDPLASEPLLLEPEFPLELLPSAARRTLTSDTSSALSSGSSSDSGS